MYILHAQNTQFIIKMIFFNHLLPLSGKKEDFRIAHGSHLGKRQPYWNFAWPTLFSNRDTLIEYLYQICCLYHNLKESYTYLLCYICTLCQSLSLTAVHCRVTGHNGHKPKWPQPKRPQTETATNRNGHKPERPQTETATNRNGHRPERPQTETATNRNGHKPERPQTETATNRNGHISCHPPHQLSPE